MQILNFILLKIVYLIQSFYPMMYEKPVSHFSTY
jgi:hypothetical protein